MDLNVFTLMQPYKAIDAKALFPDGIERDLNWLLDESDIEKVMKPLNTVNLGYSDGVWSLKKSGGELLDGFLSDFSVNADFSGCLKNRNERDFFITSLRSFKKTIKNDAFFDMYDTDSPCDFAWIPFQEGTEVNHIEKKIKKTGIGYLKIGFRIDGNVIVVTYGHPSKGNCKLNASFSGNGTEKEIAKMIMEG